MNSKQQTKNKLNKPLFEKDSRVLFKPTGFSVCVKILTGTIKDFNLDNRYYFVEWDISKSEQWIPEEMLRKLARN